MTPFETLKLHLHQHKYTKGQYKGSAPLDASRRYRNHTRVTKNIHGDMVVRMYNTDIITVTENNQIELNTAGWLGHPTTHQALNEGLHLIGIRAHTSTRRIMNITQPYIKTHEGTFLFYDHMMLDTEGKIVTPLRGFERKQTNRTETAALKQDAINSGFEALFPILYAGAQPPTMVHPPHPCGNKRVADVISDADYADKWPELVAYFKYDRKYDMKAYQYVWVELPKTKTRAAIMSAAKAGMMEVVRTDVTRL